MSCAYITIRTDEPSDLRGIVPAPQMVEPGLLIEIVSAVSERIRLCDRARDTCNLAPGIVCVGADTASVLIDDLRDVSLQVRHIEVQVPCATPLLVPEAHRVIVLIVEELETRSVTLIRREELISHPVEGCSHSSYSLRGSPSVRVVAVGDIRSGTGGDPG